MRKAKAGIVGAKSDVQRKLTAILCADVVGYSRLMGLDESSTLRTLTEHRQVFSNHIDKFRGRIVNAFGDSLCCDSGGGRKVVGQESLLGDSFLLWVDRLRRMREDAFFTRAHQIQFYVVYVEK